MTKTLYTHDFLDIESLVGYTLSDKGPYTQHCIKKGLGNFKEACRFIKTLPYDRVAADAPYLDVLNHEKGTCSSKHACLIHIAKELDLELELIVIVFWMNAQNTPRIADTLEKSPFEAIPEAHCLCRLNGKYLDLTFQGTVLPDFGELIHYQVMDCP